MFKKGICVWVFVSLVSVSWADEPVRPKGTLKQRVDPKLLQEALSLPEYQAQSPESPAALLEDLQRLADKLKKSGDTDAAELLEHFIYEYQRLTKQLTRNASAAEQHLALHVKIIEVKLDDIPADSIIRQDSETDKFRISINHGLRSTASAGKTPPQVAKEIEQELNLLVEHKKATMKVEPIVAPRSDGGAPHHEHGEFSIPIKLQRTTIVCPEFGADVEVLPTYVGVEFVRIQSRCETAYQDSDTGAASKKANDIAFDINVGESAIQSSYTSPAKDRKLFLIFKLSARR